MHISPFLVEEWMNRYETGARFNIAETCVKSISLNELFEMSGENTAFLQELARMPLTYGDIEGYPPFLEGVTRLYTMLKPEHIVPCHGAAGANHHIFYSLIEPGDRVISVMPTYQQLYDIPRSLGAEVEIHRLRRENGYLPDLQELRRQCASGVKMICINNPNNPSGALMDESMLREIAAIAAEHDAYLLGDEVYRHLTQEDVWIPSVADLYEKGISISSMSKVFSLAGIRLGWIACRDPEVRRSCLSHRDYDLISCGRIDERIGALALQHQEKLLARNRGIVRENLQVLDRWISDQPHLSYVKPQAGTTTLLHYDLDIPSVPFAKRLYAAGAFVTPGDCFEEERCVRIGYACGQEELRLGLEAMGIAVREMAEERQ